MVFSGLYPVEDTEYQALRDALEKLRLNDSAFNFEPETSIALGFGFRCGFLGMLHMEIIQERLEREFNLTLIVTAPSVRYRIDDGQGETIEIDNPSKLPPVGGHRRDGGALRPGLDLRADRVHGRHLQARPGGARRAPLGRVHRQARPPDLRLPPGRDHRGLLRPAEVHLARATRRSTTTSSSSGPRSSSSWTSSSTAIRWTRCPSSSTGTRPTSGARRWPRSSGRSSRARCSRS